MWALFVGLTFGLLASARSNAPEVKSRSCTHHGVFHVEGRDRYVLAYADAVALCLNLNTTLATEEQVHNAYNSRMETCRYGWTANMSIAILRHTAHEKCYLNQTGIAIKAANSSDLSDAYCYDETATDLTRTNCEKAINPSSTNPDSSDTATSEVPSFEDLTESPDSTAEPTLEPGLVPVNPTTDVLEPHNDTTLDVSDFGEDPTDASDLSTGEGVIAERGFNTTAVAPEENQRTGPTERTRIFFDDVTGSGTPPTEVTEAPRRHEVTDMVKTTAHPNPRSNTVNAPNIRRSEVGEVEQPPKKQEEKEGSDWLVIVGVLVALAAIVLVCAAVVTRKKWCGKHQTLNISKNGGGEGNGSAAAVVGSRAEEREQEMVTLMNKEKIQENGNAEEFTAITMEGSSEKA